MPSPQCSPSRLHISRGIRLSLGRFLWIVSTTAPGGTALVATLRQKRALERTVHEIDSPPAVHASRQAAAAGSVHGPCDGPAVVPGDETVGGTAVLFAAALAVSFAFVVSSPTTFGALIPG